MMGPDGELLGVWHDTDLHVVVGKMIAGEFVDRLDLERGEIFALCKCMSDLFTSLMEADRGETTDLKDAKFLIVGGLN